MGDRKPALAHLNCYVVEISYPKVTKGVQHLESNDPDPC